MHKRLQQINKLLEAYSAGKFDRHLDASTGNEIIDACILGINMLGEELEATTISKNYFNNIFNSVSDMVFVLNKKGVILDINLAVAAQLKQNKQQLINKSIDELCMNNARSIFKTLIKEMAENNFVTQSSYFKVSSGEKLPVQINAGWLVDERQKRKSILVLAKDITLQSQTESTIIRAIISTEEEERQRLARDLHDSLGQQLSAIKFFISAAIKPDEDENQQMILKKCNEELANVLAEMREICFNLVPKTLKEFGLLKAVKELCNNIARNNKINFVISQKNSIAHIPPDISTDIFRIIQEFIHNAHKHGQATKIKILFSADSQKINVRLRDNGVGFVLTNNSKYGMGLRNVKSRIKSHDGEITIRSVPKKGTSYFFSIPLNEF